MIKLAIGIVLAIIVCTAIVGMTLSHGASKVRTSMNASSNYEQVWNR